MSSNEKRRVAVVTGGAGGIGAAIAMELGRTGVHVVTLDPMVTLDGKERLAHEGPTTAQRIVEAGGSARTSNASVTDRDAVRQLFGELAGEFGGLDAVVNVAGISSPTSFSSGSEVDWGAVLGVHLAGYLNVLGEALPLMSGTGKGKVLGVTSGSGWRPANAGAYGFAKRAVASLTWQIGRVTPPGVTVNALSPIAETRMVTASRARSGNSGSKTGGITLATAPPPEHLGPIAAYLTSEAFDWASGEVIFSNGSEVAWITPPRLLEVCRTADSRSLAHILAKVIPTAFVAAEGAQASNGAGNPRFEGLFEAPGAPPPSTSVRRCVIVTDDPSRGAALADALAARGVTCVGVGAWGDAQHITNVAADFDGASAQIAGSAQDGEPLDAVVVALSDHGSTIQPEVAEWERVLSEHSGLPDRMRSDAGWARAVADYSSQANRAVRLVSVIDATNAGGSSRAQAGAQLARSAHSATEGRVNAFVISVETANPSEDHTVAEVAAHLLCGADTAALAGAELVVGEGWLGLRSHPAPATSITYGGPAVPDWLGGILRTVIEGTAQRS